MGRSQISFCTELPNYKKAPYNGAFFVVKLADSDVSASSDSSEGKST
jgi:hypothetical protein